MQIEVHIHKIIKIQFDPKSAVKNKLARKKKNESKFSFANSI